MPTHSYRFNHGCFLFPVEKSLRCLSGCAIRKNLSSAVFAKLTELQKLVCIAMMRIDKAIKSDQFSTALTHVTGFYVYFMATFAGRAGKCLLTQKVPKHGRRDRVRRNAIALFALGRSNTKGRGREQSERDEVTRPKGEGKFSTD